MTYATTFSGIGGWELGLNACGWELKWQCERDAWCRRLLAERFGVPIYEDIRTICEQSPPPVDALIGSPPCQPFSSAGLRGGESDERHLYPAFATLVGLIKPRWVLMENVAVLASDGPAFGGYIGGLASLGYDVLWHCIPASNLGANHERDRVWIIAHSTGKSGVHKSNAWEAEKRLHNHADYWRANPWDEAKPRILGMDDGTAGRVDRTCAIGNAIVPQIAQIIGQAINQIESEII